LSSVPESPTPFVRLSREVVVENPWHRYCMDRYTQRDGSAGTYHYVDIAGSAATIPLFSDGTVVLVEGFRYLLDCWLLEFPIGGMQAGESALSVAQRELEEEAGLVACDWHSIGSFAPYKGVSNEICHYFVARDLEWTAQRLEPSEDIRVHRMPLGDARRRLLDARPADGQSLAGLLFLDRWLACESGGALDCELH